MRQNKGTNFISELQKYFASEQTIIQTLFTELRSLKFLNSVFQSLDKANSRYPNLHTFLMLVLFPFFDVKEASKFSQSSLNQMFNCGKDLFYRFLNHPEIDWRHIAFKINIPLISKIAKSSYSEDNENPKCLIADDTDLPKSGMKFELLSRIHSHAKQRYNYGFKALFIGLHDGKSFFGIDFSLHGEKGKQEKKEYGLTKKQQNKRFSNKKRKSESKIKTRVL